MLLHSVVTLSVLLHSVCYFTYVIAQCSYFTYVTAQCSYFTYVNAQCSYITAYCTVYVTLPFLLHSVVTSTMLLQCCYLR